RVVRNGIWRGRRRRRACVCAGRGEDWADSDARGDGEPVLRRETSEPAAHHEQPVPLLTLHGRAGRTYYLTDAEVLGSWFWVLGSSVLGSSVLGSSVLGSSGANLEPENREPRTRESRPWRAVSAASFKTFHQRTSIDRQSRRVR